MKKCFIIKLIVYPFNILVSIGQSDKEIEKVLNNLGIFNGIDELIMDETVRGRTLMLDSNQTIIRLKFNKNKNEFISLISHEIFHAATFILYKIGLEFDINKSDEAYAYLIEYLTKQILDEVYG